MKKVELLGLMAVVVLVFTGCASSLEKNWGLTEDGKGVISDLKIEIEKTAVAPNVDGVVRKYEVTLYYCGKTAKSYVSREAFERYYVGQVVELKLLVAITKDKKDEKGDRFCIATYTWLVPYDGSGVWVTSFNEPTERRLK